jgi:aspartokinase
MLIVMKFGGTSVGSAERILAAAELVSKSVRDGHQVVVVTSAMSGVTNGLIDAARAASKGHWDPKLRVAMFERHKAVADAIVPDRGRREAALA